jgi:hypothetical protein
LCIGGIEFSERMVDTVASTLVHCGAGALKQHKARVSTRPVGKIFNRGGGAVQPLCIPGLALPQLSWQQGQHLHSFLFILQQRMMEAPNLSNDSLKVCSRQTTVRVGQCMQPLVSSCPSHLPALVQLVCSSSMNHHRHVRIAPSETAPQA